MATLFVDKLDPQSGTALEIGTSGDTVTVPSGATFNVAGTLQSGGSAITQGITGADQWRITASVTSDGDITANLERSDRTAAAQGSMGLLMTQSSGVFTFPATGYWLVRFDATGQSTGADNLSMAMRVTIDNANYYQPAYCSQGVAGAHTTYAAAQSILDVTDLSNVKVKFNAQSLAAGSLWYGDTNENYTYFTFIRLGDT